ncbi:MAG: IPExxxVDY family protein [Flavobacteriaceae bacterium]|nr:IPExxxVDY family protein [Flavobacteriaceae bacterium]
MALHKLLVDDFEENSYLLLAIHCTIEDYRLAYLLNKHLKINLKRNSKDLDFEYIVSSYSIFEWDDINQDITWSLVSNICKKEEESLTSSGSLFNASQKITRTHNLIPELKKVNYLLKIDTDGRFINGKLILNKIQEIPQVVAAYTVDVFELKSKDNLIFN